MLGAVMVAGRVPLKIIYLLVRRILGLAVLVFRTDLAKDAELLVLRHENAVLRCHASGIRYEPAGHRPLPRRRTGRSPVRFQNSAIGPDLGFYVARSYSLMRPPSTGRRWIRFRERSATGWSGRGGQS
jgi:hypothetical protein